jgi:ABC-type glycerol-3-phosphate transport system substrate-binding protein
VRKITYILIVLFTAALLCSSCSKPKNNTSSDNSAADIKIAVFYSEDEQGKIYKSLAKAYMEENPGSKVEVVYNYSNSDEISRTLSSDGGIDVIGLTRSQLIEYSKSGYLTDISSLSNEADYDNTLYPVSISYGSYNGKLYGIGDMPMTMEWFYNKDIFDKYNLSEPKDFNELKAICKTLKSNGIAPVSLGGMDGWTVSLLLGTITAQTAGSSDLTTNYGSDKNAFTSIKGIYDGFDILGEIFSSCIGDECGKINYIQSIKDFVNGDAAILPALSTSKDAIDDMKSKGFSYGVFKNGVAFSNNPESKYSASAAQVLAVPKNSSKQKEAQDFLKFVFSEKGQKCFTDQKFIAPLKSANSEGNDVNKAVLSHLEATNDDSIMYYDNISPDMLTNSDTVLANVADGIVDAKDAWNKILNLTFSK